MQRKFTRSTQPVALRWNPLPSTRDMTHQEFRTPTISGVIYIIQICLGGIRKSVNGGTVAYRWNMVYLQCRDSIYASINVINLWSKGKVSRRTWQQSCLRWKLHLRRRRGQLNGWVRCRVTKYVPNVSWISTSMSEQQMGKQRNTRRQFTGRDCWTLYRPHCTNIIRKNVKFLVKEQRLSSEFMSDLN